MEHGSHGFFKLRTNILKLVVGIAFAVIVVRLFNIQILQHQYYVEEAAKQQTMRTTIVAKRGEIYMMDGETPVIAAMNTKVWTVILDPQIARTNREEVEKIINKEARDYIVADWNDVFASLVLRYYVVAKNVPYSVAQKIKEEDLAGVYYQETTKRVYPEGTLGAKVLGFVNADGIGQYGIEEALNEDLTGQNGVLKTVKDVNNTPLTIGDQNVKIPAVNGKNIVLTIDRNIQYATEQILAESTEEYGVKYASAIVMDPRTGEILALAGVPSYDPGDYGNVEDASVYQIEATQGLYEPASICKTFTFAAAINEGKMTPETRYDNTGSTVVDGWRIANAITTHTGNIDMQEALSFSLNTGSVQALRLLGGSELEITEVGKEKLYDYYFNRFRLTQYTGVELAESQGIIYAPGTEEATDARYANMTFGQGLMMSLMQLAAGYVAVVNGGDYYTPTIIAGEIKEDGTFEHRDVSEPDSGVITPETSATMRRMLQVARSNYKGSKEADGNCFVGGKTGTAQTIDPETGAYTDAQTGRTEATYVGFGAKNEDELPEYLIALKIWDDEKRTTGETNAKPVFDKISSYMIRYLHWDV